MTTPVRGVVSGASAGAVTGTSITVNAPVGLTSGDQLIVAISERDDQTGHVWTAPSGWTLIERLVDTGEGFFYRAQYGTDVTGSSWTWTNNDGATDKWAWACLALDGSQVGAYHLGDADVKSTTSTSGQTPTITTTVPSVVVAFAGDRISGGSSWTWPAGWTEQADVRTDTGTNAVSMSAASHNTVPHPAGSISANPTASISSGAGWSGIFAYALPSGTTSGSGTGATQTLGLTPGSGVGRAGGAASPLSLPLTPSTASGRQGYTGNGDGLLVAITFGGGVGYDAVTPEGVGAALTLPLVVGDGAGGAVRYLFTGPTQDVHFAIKPGTGLIGAFQYGLTVWRADGVWHTAFSPSLDRTASADLIYSGGRVHTVDTVELAALIAGGFGDYITLETL